MSLIDRYQYRANYLPNVDEFRQHVRSQDIIPHQVEIQPAPPRGSLCWLPCPYCYGGSATDTGDRLTDDRAVSILEEIAAGGVPKVIFAGYATDPLNAPAIDDLLSTAISWGLVFGFNTKALRVSPRFLSLLSSSKIVEKSYLSVSVDAGSNRVYNAVHGVKNSAAQLYDRVLQNVTSLAQARKSGAPFDLSATYLIMAQNAQDDEIRKFVTDFRAAGCNLLRFTFPQLPCGTDELLVPSQGECAEYRSQLDSLLPELDTPACRVLVVDADREHDLFHKPRTLPCIARWVFPTVGFDGWLYPCSQTAAPNFRGLSLGDLARNNFWDLFYDYPPTRMLQHLEETGDLMNAVRCRCDRKAHLVNLEGTKGGLW